MGPEVDKLFLQVAGRPVVAHTWLRFDHSREIDEVVLVIRAGLEAAFKEIGAALELTKPWRAVTGGAERQDSVWNGLQAVSSDLVAIQVQRCCQIPDRGAHVGRAVQDDDQLELVERIHAFVEQREQGG